MTFFDWNPLQGKSIASSEIWIYFIIVVRLTVAVVGLWFMLIQRAKRGKGIIAGMAVEHLA